MTEAALVITQADVDWFLKEIPGTSMEELERLKKKGIVEVKEDE